MTTAVGVTSQPRYWGATIAVALLFLGLPALLLTIDPGSGDELIPAGETQTAEESITYQAPAGWSLLDVPGEIALGKGAVSIEMVITPFTGTAAAAYDSFVSSLSSAVNLTSSSDPAPATLAGLDAVSGTLHYIYEGTDTTLIAVIATDATNSIRVSMDGPIGNLQPLKAEFESIVESVKVTP